MVELRQDIKYPQGVELIRNLYFLSALFIALLSIILFLIQDYKRFGDSFLQFVFSFLAFYGIDKRKEWTVPAVLILSAWGLINSTFNFMSIARSQGSQISFYIGTLTALIFFVFYIYCIFIFSRRETRLFFNERGKILF